MAAKEGDVKYQTQTVKSVRGMEARAAAKWEQQGWEIVSTTTGRITSELTIRRPVPKTPWKLLAGLGGGIAVLIAFAVIVGVVSGDREDVAKPVDSPAASSPSSKPSETPLATSEPEEPPATVDAEPTVITAVSNPDFAALLALTDYCAPEVAAFAEAYQGETVEFDGFIGAMNAHDGASTRYDILINVGDFDPDSGAGPAFQYRDVNASYDMHWTDAQPDRIGVGTNLHLVAQIDKYEDTSCLFLLDPVETAGR